ncbi:TRAP-type C4-dicarboxylate transport system substrate-binding protein [Kribbella amoyensis]|uniref:TRAP-type C4-dicarboxylate transport system substrate-binding protein n=1 Tax=Kribbella amoyensis TaxID=996641 RepID=A0A561AZH8_9ACTN|nr:TRAP transporter substrate-binding protein DctP [Kribbella amoyensis]TWD72013.1 TRAP-type C4-dicarboxylate transport system substrate-binding protein [Kribbella amoyensis]
MTAILRRLLAAAVLASLLTGCLRGTTSGDKAGGHGAPIVLRLAGADPSLEDEPAVAYFAQRVGQRSGHRLKVEIVNGWGGSRPSAEQRVVRAVAGGKADLGWVGTRVFDTLGVRSLQALTAPMLVDSYPVQRAVIESELPEQLLSPLDTLKVTGLAVLADGLQKPVGTRQPLLDPGDWAGIGFQSARSELHATSILALGATPVELCCEALDQALVAGTASGLAQNLRTYQDKGMENLARYVTVNVNLWPQTLALIAGSERFAQLTGRQRSWIRAAAADAVQRSLDLADNDAQYVHDLCGSVAFFATASQPQLADLRRAFVGVYRELERDPLTKATIGRIRQLKDAATPAEDVDIPPACTRARAEDPPAARPATALTGVYRWTLTEDDALALGTSLDRDPGKLASMPWIFTMTLGPQTWTLHRNARIEKGSGSYLVEGHRITFFWPRPAGISVLTFTVSENADGDLTLEPELPMNPHDQFLWSTHPWTKVG